MRLPIREESRAFIAGALAILESMKESIEEVWPEDHQFTRAEVIALIDGAATEIMNDPEIREWNNG